MASSGSVTAWLRDIAGGTDFATLTAEAAATRPGADGLVALPYFAGERTPFADPDARGVIAGLTLRHGRGHLYRALLEATAYGVRHNLDEFASAGCQIDRIVAVGGGTRGSLWPQVVSDVTGQPQQLPEQRIGAAYGDAKLAAVAIGDAAADDQWNHITGIVERCHGNARVYDDLYRAYRTLHPATADIQHALARHQRSLIPELPASGGRETDPDVPEVPGKKA
jgi:xylulokinase